MAQTLSAPTAPAGPGADPAAEALARLVQDAARGDEAAWSALVDRFSGVVWAVARAHRLDEADAADVVQTTWLRLVERLGTLREPAGVGSWLATTAQRESLRALRRRARTIPAGDELPEAAAEARDLAAGLADRDRDAVVRAALDRLRPRDRALLRMLVADPAPSYREIGATLGMPVGSIGPTRARCLRRLRRETERLGLTAALAT